MSMINTRKTFDNDKIKNLQDQSITYTEDDILNQIAELKQLVHDTNNDLDKDFSEIENKIEALINKK